jgi:hypothetical protein
LPYFPMNIRVETSLVESRYFPSFRKRVSLTFGNPATFN